jgi:hypothetical protein
MRDDIGGYGGPERMISQDREGVEGVKGVRRVGNEEDGVRKMGELERKGKGF